MTVSGNGCTGGWSGLAGLKIHIDYDWGPRKPCPGRKCTRIDSGPCGSSAAFLCESRFVNFVASRPLSAFMAIRVPNEADRHRSVVQRLDLQCTTRYETFQIIVAYLLTIEFIEAFKKPVGKPYLRHQHKK